jgi:hypothetical protein
MRTLRILLSSSPWTLAVRMWRVRVARSISVLRSGVWLERGEGTSSARRAPVAGDGGLFERDGVEAEHALDGTGLFGDGSAGGAGLCAPGLVVFEVLGGDAVERDVGLEHEREVLEGGGDALALAFSDFGFHARDLLNDCLI